MEPYSNSSEKRERKRRDAILDSKLIDRTRREYGAGGIYEPIAARTRSCLKSQQSKTSPQPQEHTTAYPVAVITQTQQVNRPARSSARAPDLRPCLVWVRQVRAGPRLLLVAKLCKCCSSKIDTLCVFLLILQSQQTCTFQNFYTRTPTRIPEQTSAAAATPAA